MRRWAEFVNAVRANYAAWSAEPWHVAGDTAEQRDALNRIVVKREPTGTTADQDGNTGYRHLIDMYPTVPSDADRNDRIVVTRHVRTRFELWADDADTLEDRLHGLYAALAVTSESGAYDYAEEWPGEDNLTMGGASCSLICTLNIGVLLASDIKTLRDGAPLGEGRDTEPVDTAEANVYVNDDVDPDFTIVKERET